MIKTDGDQRPEALARETPPPKASTPKAKRKPRREHAPAPYGPDFVTG